MDQVTDFIISTLFLIFLLLFLVLGNSPALQRWLDRVTGASGQGGEGGPERETREEVGGRSSLAREYESMIFEKLALAGEKGRTAVSLAEDLHFERPLVEDALASMENRGIIRRGGLLGRKFVLSEKGREHAVQEGIIPSIRSKGG